MSIGAPDAIWLPSSSVPKKLSIESSGSVAAQLKDASKICPSENVWLLVGEGVTASGCSAPPAPAVAWHRTSSSGAGVAAGAPLAARRPRRRRQGIVQTVPSGGGRRTTENEIVHTAHRRARCCTLAGLRQRHAAAAGMCSWPSSVQASAPLVFVNPIGLSSVDAAGSVSVNVMVCAVALAVVVLRSRSRSSRMCLRLIGRLLDSWS